MAMRARHDGTVLSIVGVMTKRRTLRFWSRVRRDGDDKCWLWIGGNVTAVGYGLMQGCVRYVKYSFGVHRIAFTLGHGREPVGVVMHACDVPLCCNPSHLRDGSYRDNMQDAKRKGRIRSGVRRFASEDRLAAVEAYRGGETQASIARRLGIASRHVQAWIGQAGLAVVRGPYAERRRLPTAPTEEWAVSDAWRRLDRAENGRFTRSIKAEQVTAGAAGFAAGSGSARALGPTPQDREGAEHG